MTTAIGFANPVFDLQAPSQQLGRADELIEESAQWPLTGHPKYSDQCLLSGVKRTSFGHAPMSANDPKRTCGSDVLGLAYQPNLIWFGWRNWWSRSEGHMHRREFMAYLGGAALVGSFEARAQQSLPLIGILHEGLAAPLSLTVSFQQGLIQGGVSQGSSVKIENRSADGEYGRLPSLAGELINQRVGIIAAAYLVAARAAQAATRTVPIVFITGSDPVAAGLVSSINRPTSNSTGVAFLFTRLGEKNLATLHELAPNARVVGALVNPNNPNAGPQAHDLQEAARSLDLQIVILSAGSDAEIDNVFTTFRERHIEALLVTADGFFFGLQNKLAILSARYGVPTFYPLSDYVTAGGLISYGANLSESWRQAGIYVAKILKGAKPADLPVMQSEKFELAINLKTAKALNVIVPASLIARADTVIE